MLPAVVDDDGTIRVTGTVVLRAHGGALSVPLVGARGTGEALVVDDPVQGSPHALPLVLLTASGDGSYETRLAREADVLFLYNYVPGSPFDPLTVRPAA